MVKQNIQTNKNEADIRWWEQPSVVFAFNLPRVSAQLERLMGTNVVRLTDRKYMMELRRRIHEDFNDMLSKRIERREHIESEREKNLILKGLYTAENCPPRLVDLHSVVLAKELERQRNLLLEGKTTQCTTEFDKHAVFLANRMTNKVIITRRSKLKTNRQKNAERLIRQGAKWEKERLLCEALDKKRENESQERRVQALLQEDEYYKANKLRGMDLLRIQNRDFTENEMEMKKFIDSQNDSSYSTRMQQSTKRKKLQSTETESITEIETSKEIFSQFKDRTNIPEINEPKPSDSLHSIDTHKPLDDLTDDENSELSDNSDNESVRDANNNEREIVIAQQHAQLMEERKDEAIENGYMLPTTDISKLPYEDPMVMKLKKTDTVKDMYDLAEEIICGTVLTENKIN